MLIRLRALVLAPLLALPLWPALAHAQPGVRAAAIGRDSGATAAAAADTRLRVFLDCQNAPCDRNFFITDLPFSLWTQDRRDADVHLLSTRIGTASGGGEYSLNFVGQRSFAGRVDTLITFLPPNTTDDIRRRELARVAKVKLATAESCTGGLVASRITDVAGASEVFMGGWVTYSNEGKMRELGVKAESLERYGAVSGVVAGEMAEGARRRSGADWAVAVTGIAGPGGGSPGKPVGLVYLGIAGVGGVETIEKKLVPERKTFKAMASQAALNLLRVKLLANPFQKTEV